MYRLDNLTYPTVDEGLVALQVAPSGLSRPERYRSGGYIKRLPQDPWGNAYQYLQPGESGPFDVYSLGADGRLGGEGSNADIGNWE
jgi:general secretion pathway protein G